MVIGVYGLGRFGAFWARTLSSQFTVKGYSRNPNRTTPPGVERTDWKGLLECDVIFLCVAISAMEEVVRDLAAQVRPGTLIADTCSVKVHPATLMQEGFDEKVSLLCTHPMFGPDSGRNGVDGLPFVYSPLRMAEEDQIFWKEIFQRMGLRVVEMTPDEHDREAAYTQGITHFIGRTLSDLDLKDSAIGTTGYERLRDIMGQTCNDPWQLFLDLQYYNPYTQVMRRDLVHSLNRILGELKDPHHNEGLRIQEMQNAESEE